MQRRFTLNYGSNAAGSTRARSDNSYYPVFYLDFLSVIGRPLLPISRASDRILDNVTISLQHWQAHYSVKHAKGLPYDMTGRTFRLASGATREIWFIVMHPTRAAPTEARRRAKNGRGAKRTSLARSHADVLVGHIKKVFLDGELLGEGVEPSWTLGGRESQTIAYNKWVAFQRLFMERWSSFVAEHGHDRFWQDNRPAFHTYDYGANIEIAVTEQLHALERETPLRPSNEDDDDDEDHEGGGGTSGSEGEDDDAYANTQNSHLSSVAVPSTGAASHRAWAFNSSPHPSGAASVVSSGLHALASVAEAETTEVQDDHETQQDCGASSFAANDAHEGSGAAGRSPSLPLGSSPRPSVVPSVAPAGLQYLVDAAEAEAEADANFEQWLAASGQSRPTPSINDSLFVRDEAEESRLRQEGLYSEGLRNLRAELEQKYDLCNVDNISYALAANLHCVGSSQAGAQTMSLLADRNRVAREYSGSGDFTFFPLGFHPAFGNFSSPEPPAFLAGNLLTIMRDNMSFQNDGADVLSFGFFQAYSNIKRSIRHRADDLLATQGSATAALTVPSADVDGNAWVRARQQRLLGRLRGQLTPDDPEASTPFARECQRIEAAMAGQELAFRFEQVISINVQRLVPARRDFSNVLQPIFQLMRFFLKERQAYLGILRQFPPSAFPGVLVAFAKVFAAAMEEMERRYCAEGSRGLGLALSEGVAALDRLGNFCFTGDPRVLPSRVLRPLKTMESLREGGWPFISPDMLDFRQGHGLINLRRWPKMNDGRPVLMHVAALAFHYGPKIAANRHSQLWFAELGGRSIKGLEDTAGFVEEVLRDLWTAQTRSFVCHQVRQRLNRGARGGRSAFEADSGALSLAREAITNWEDSSNPFSWM